MARIENWNPPKLDLKTAIYTWDVDYAADVHEGKTGRGGSYPGRPWTDDAIGRVDMERVMYDAYQDSHDIQQAFFDFAQTYYTEFHISMESNTWDWSRATRRKSGEYVEAGSRDIIDLGNLYDSQSLEFA
jgi:hypothetical protein